MIINKENEYQMPRELDTSPHLLSLCRDYEGQLSLEMWTGIPLLLWVVSFLTLRKVASFSPSSQDGTTVSCCSRLVISLSSAWLPDLSHCYLHLDGRGWGAGGHPSWKWRRGCVEGPGYSTWLLSPAVLPLHILQEPRMSLGCLAAVPISREGQAWATEESLHSGPWGVNKLRNQVPVELAFGTRKWLEEPNNKGENETDS